MKTQPEQEIGTSPNQETQVIGAIAQLGERLPCTQEVSGSIPLSSTTYLSAKWLSFKSLLIELVFK
jgi:hypothetical protein